MNQHVCRCCLLEQPAPTYNIFDGASRLRLELALCAPNVSIEPEDGLPELICELCWLRIRAAVDFRQRCEESDRELRKRYEDENRAIEEVLGLGGILRQIDRDVNGSIVDCAGGDGEAEKIVAILGEDAGNLADFEPLEISMLDALLLDSYSFSSIPDTGHSVRTSDEDHTITELLNRVLDDATFETTKDATFGTSKDALLTNELIDNSIGQQSFATYAVLDNEGNRQAYTHTAPILFPEAIAIETPAPTTAIHEVIGNTIGQPNSSSDTDITKPFSKQDNENIPLRKANIPTPQPPKPATKKSSASPKSLHPCSECEKKFTRNFQLKLHLISVHNIGDGLQYTCTECQMTFASRHSLSYHQKKIHSEERPFACAECSRRFILRTQLASHMRIHTGNAKPRIFQCPSAGCDKTWPTKSDLHTHMRSHDPSVVRKWNCDRCEKSFYTRGHLNSHILVHTGQKPFACALCEKSYQSVGNLNNHMFQHHGHLILGKMEPGRLLET